MPGFIWGYGEKGPTSGLKPPGMKQALGPNTEYPEGETCYLQCKKGKSDGGPRAHDFDAAFELDDERMKNVEPQRDGVCRLTGQLFRFAYYAHERCLRIQLRQVLQISSLCDH